MDYGISNVRTDVNASDCTRGYTDTVRKSDLKVDSGEKKKNNNLAALEYRTCVSGVPVRRSSN